MHNQSFQPAIRTAEQIRTEKADINRMIDKIYRPYGLSFCMLYWNGKGKKQPLRYYKKNRARLIRRSRIVIKRKNGNHGRVMAIGIWNAKPITERLIVAASFGTFGALAYSLGYAMGWETLHGIASPVPFSRW